MAFHRGDRELYGRLTCFHLKKWLTAFVVLLNIAGVLFQLANTVSYMCDKQFELKFTVLLKTAMLLTVAAILLSMFLYGIVEESLCLSCTYACLVATVTAMLLLRTALVMQHNDSIQSDHHQPNQYPSLLGRVWLVNYWEIITTAVAALYCLDLWRIQRMRNRCSHECILHYHCTNTSSSSTSTNASANISFLSHNTSNQVLTSPFIKPMVPAAVCTDL